MTHAEERNDSQTKVPFDVKKKTVSTPVVFLVVQILPTRFCIFNLKSAVTIFLFVCAGRQYRNVMNRYGYGFLRE